MTRGRYAEMDAWELVSAVQRGDREAFGQLYVRYRELVWAYARRRVSHELAEDLTQETFVRALAAVNSVHDQGKDVAAWLLTIARNLVLDHAKRSSTQREVLEPDLSYRAGRMAFSADSSRSLDDQVIADLVASSAAAALRARIAQLPRTQQHSLAWRYVYELPNSEAARRMGKSTGAVKALQARAVKSLRVACRAKRRAVA